MATKKQLRKEIEQLNKSFSNLFKMYIDTKEENDELSNMLPRYGYANATPKERLSVVLTELSNLREAQYDFNSEIERLQAENKELRATKIGVNVGERCNRGGCSGKISLLNKRDNIIGCVKCTYCTLDTQNR